MELTWIYTSDNMDWEALSHLYRIAPLGDKKPDALKPSFQTLFKCFVYDRDKLIGAGRALADGLDCSYIADVATHSEYQEMGIGKGIVSKLVELSTGHRKVILYSVPGKERFTRNSGSRVCHSL